MNRSGKKEKKKKPGSNAFIKETLKQRLLQETKKGTNNNKEINPTRSTTVFMYVKLEHLKT